MLAAIVTAQANFTGTQQSPWLIHRCHDSGWWSCWYPGEGRYTIAGDPTLSGSATDVLAAIVTAETKRTSLVPNNHPTDTPVPRFRLMKLRSRRRERYHTAGDPTLSGSATDVLGPPLQLKQSELLDFQQSAWLIHRCHDSGWWSWYPGETHNCWRSNFSGSATDVLAAIVTAETKRITRLQQSPRPIHTGATIQAGLLLISRRRRYHNCWRSNPFWCYDVLAAIVTAETKRTSLVPNNHPDWYTGATIQADEVADIRRREIPQLLEINPGSAPMC